MKSGPSVPDFPTATTQAPVLSDQEFRQIRDWLHQQSGIHLSEVKKSMVVGRLQKRLKALAIPTFHAYLKFINLPTQLQERQIALNLLTTNETYFFREEKHFSFLQQVLPAFEQQPLRIWSAAASSGEEAYSIALLLAQQLGLAADWQVIGTDINTAVLNKAKQALYPIDASHRIALPLLQAFCLKGIGKENGRFKMGPELCRHVQFMQANLFDLQAKLPQFDVIFLRNVLIYFELEDKKKIIQNVIRQLKPGGWLLVGHSESIHGYLDSLQQVRPSCYQYKKPVGRQLQE